MAHAWNACWVHALGGSNPPSSATESPCSRRGSLRFPAPDFSPEVPNEERSFATSLVKCAERCVVDREFFAHANSGASLEVCASASWASARDWHARPCRVDTLHPRPNALVMRWLRSSGYRRNCMSCPAYRRCADEVAAARAPRSTLLISHSGSVQSPGKQTQFRNNASCYRLRMEPHRYSGYIRAWVSGYTRVRGLKMNAH